LIAIVGKQNSLLFKKIVTSQPFLKNQVKADEKDG